MAVNCMWIFSIKFKLLSTQVITIVEQLMLMKQHWLFCNIINALWQTTWSRRLWSPRNALTVRLSVCQSRAAPSDIIVSIHITALGDVSDRIEMACCHIRLQFGHGSKSLGQKVVVILQYMMDMLSTKPNNRSSSIAAAAAVESCWRWFSKRPLRICWHTQKKMQHRTCSVTQDEPK